MTIKADTGVMLPQTKAPEPSKEETQRGTQKAAGMANGVKMCQKVKQGNTVIYYWRWD